MICLFWNVKPYIVEYNWQRFGGTFCLHLRGCLRMLGKKSVFWTAGKMEAVMLSEALEPVALYPRKRDLDI